MSSSYQHSEVLFHQGRYLEAISELKAVIASDPEDYEAKALLTLCLCESEQPEQAINMAQEVLEAAPYDATTHWIMARCHLENNNSKKALEYATQAIEIDPEDEAYFRLRAQIYCKRNLWEKALNDIESALAIDPEDTDSANLKNFILVQLKRKDDAFAGIDDSLQKDPNDSDTHASKGWALMHEGKFKEAQKHFTEALRISPNNEFAKQGALECLRAKSGIYGLLLRFQLFMSTLSPVKQFAILIGAYLLIEGVSRIKTESMTLKVVLSLILIIYIFFALSTWLGKTLTNFFLQFNAMARIALSRKERFASNIILPLVSLSGCLYLLYAIYDLILVKILAMFALTFSLPLCRYLEADPGRQTRHYRMWVLGFVGYYLLSTYFIFTNVDLFLNMLSNYHYLVLAFCIFGNFKDN